MFFSLQDKAAFITGGISGIGLAVAQRFIAAGARVVVTDIRDGRDIAAEMGAMFIQANVADEAAMARAFTQAEEAVGKLDVVVNNAGIGDLGPLDAIDAALWDKVMRVNVYGVFHGIKHGARHMNDGGSIINTASQAAFTTMHGFEPYSASKSAVVSLTQTAAVELGPRGIRVNAVCPTSIHTPLVPPDDPEFAVTRVFTQFGRVGETEDVVGLYHFLAADESRFITGQAILVDGGWTAGLSQGVTEMVARCA